MESPTLLNRRRLCAACGDDVPEGVTACPRDGSTVFATASLMMEPLVKTDPLLGARLGDYEVLEAIGDGGMGIVYRGLQPIIQKRVAIKVLRPDVANDKNLVSRFLAEAKAVNAISHRNIVDIFTLGTLPDGRPYIVMELLDGVPLDKYLRSAAPLSPRETVELLLDISAPLGAAHAAGIIHRDLKPSNVFLVKQADGTRYLKLLDFGLAKWSFDGHSAQTSSMMVTGTPDYMSPEQARGLEATPKSDLYALGVMAFEMLTGQVPFKGATPMDVMMQHVQAVPPEIPHCPPGLQAIVRAMMAKKPEARLAPTERVREELRRVVLDPTARSRALMPPEETPRSWLMPVVAGIPVVAAVAVTAFVLLRAPEPTPVVAAPPPAPAPRAMKVEEVAPAPVVVADPTPTPPVVAPAPAPAKVVKPAPPVAGLSPEALTARINKLEARLRKSVDPGEEPDPSALVLLKKLRLSVATSRTAVEHKDIDKSLDEWEHTFLKGARP